MKDSKYAPIIIFAFNRLEPLKATVSSVLSNPEASESDLFIFVDGPRPNKEGEKDKVQSVQSFVKTISGFKSLTYYFSDRNKGLAGSIISGTTEVINKYGRVIVLEDDLYVSQSFLRFMNEMLGKFECVDKVMQISGYGTLLTHIGSYKYHAYLNLRARSWSWATWKNRWDTVDWDVKDYNQIKKSKKLQCEFNKGGSDLFGMLKGYFDHTNNSWYIRFDYSMHKQSKYSIQPVRSLVRNDGFGTNATHCSGYNRFKIDFEPIHEGDFLVPLNLEPNLSIIKNAIRFNSIPYRIYGKLISFLKVIIFK